MRSAVSHRRPSLSDPRGELNFFWLLVPLALAVRLVYSAKVLLVPDEAFYWTLSRHLAMGYLDHPPMIAYLIKLGTLLVGSNELGVRIVAVMMSVGTMMLVVLLARRVLPEIRSAVWVAIIWLTSPLLAALGTIFTPDTPVIFFSLCGLYAVALIAHQDDQSARENKPPPASIRLWLLFGLFSGLAMDSKYTGVLLPTGVALAMLFSRTGRAHYRRPWIYLSGILAVAIFSPVIYWNATHQWISFLFQLHHGTMPGENVEQFRGWDAVLRLFRDLGIYLGGQAAIFTPVLFVIGLDVLIEYWWRLLTGTRSIKSSGRVMGRLPLGGIDRQPGDSAKRQAAEQPPRDPLEAVTLNDSLKQSVSQVERVLLWSATLPLVLFGLAALRSHHTEANWPGFAYLPLSLLMARWLSEKWDGQRLHWARVGVIVALAGTIGMYVVATPPVTLAMVRSRFHVTHQLEDLVGWKQYGRWLGDLSAQTGAPVITNRHQDAGEAAFYMPGQPEVWCVSIGTRPTAFDYFDDRLEFATMPALIWVGGNYRLFEKEYGYAETGQFSATIIPAQRNPRIYAAFLLTRSPR